MLTTRDKEKLQNTCKQTAGVSSNINLECSRRSSLDKLAGKIWRKRKNIYLYIELENETRINGRRFQARLTFWIEVNFRMS